MWIIEYWYVFINKNAVWYIIQFSEYMFFDVFFSVILTCSRNSHYSKTTSDSQKQLSYKLEDLKRVFSQEFWIS